jgi:inorganic phosphate transporter, PiT family
MSVALILLAVLCLAYANGANDNFKGVATLFGSGTTNYRVALTLATGATLLGSLAAVFLAGKLLQAFSGKGLVADHLVSDPGYVASVASAAGLTVLLATRLGLPISTTHSLVGALVGAGWAAGSVLDLARLGASFFAPLLISPLLALGLTCGLYPICRRIRQRAGITEETCLCVGTETLEVVPAECAATAVLRAEELTVQVGTEVECRTRYRGNVLGINAASALDRLHFLSAGVVSFARGLNDTPKIAALLLLVPALGSVGGIALVGGAIAVGGVVSARKVAETMSRRITPMSHGQGFLANLLTGAIVIGASRLGLPVSTTHVSCGALFGIGTVTRQGNLGTIGTILAAWVTTLPLGAAMGALCYRLFASFA